MVFIGWGGIGSSTCSGCAGRVAGQVRVARQVARGRSAQPANSEAGLVPWFPGFRVPHIGLLAGKHDFSASPFGVPSSEYPVPCATQLAGRLRQRRSKYPLHQRLVVRQTSCAHQKHPPGVPPAVRAARCAHHAGLSPRGDFGRHGTRSERPRRCGNSSRRVGNRCGSWEFLLDRRGPARTDRFSILTRTGPTDGFRTSRIPAARKPPRRFSTSAFYRNVVNKYI